MKLSKEKWKIPLRKKERKELSLETIFLVEEPKQKNSLRFIFQARLVRRTPEVGAGEPRKALCSLPTARSPAHCLGLAPSQSAGPSPRGGRTMPGPLEAEAAATDCSGCPGHCGGPSRQLPCSWSLCSVAKAPRLRIQGLSS